MKNNEMIHLQAEPSHTLLVQVKKPFTKFFSLKRVCGLCAWTGLLVVSLIFLFTLLEALPMLHPSHLLNFFAHTSWYPTENQFGLWPIIIGTLYATLGAILIAAPLALLSAFFCQFYASKWIAQSYRAVLELLAGIPSVVYGLWGLVVVVPLVAQWQGPGASLFAAIIVLSLMILPIGALLADAALTEMSPQFRTGCQALGLSDWAYIRTIALPQSSQGLINALLIQAGRALGETMAVLMVSGNIPMIPNNLFEPVRTLSANIALEMAYALDAHRAALYVSGFILLILASLLAFLIRPNSYEQQS